MSLADLNKATQSESELLARISEARNPSEPIEPTEEPAPVDVSEEMPEEAIAETEELAESLESNEEPEELSSLIYDIEGEEVDLETILGWKKGSMLDADYTQKSQANAELRKTMEGELTSIQERGESLKGLIDALESSINADIPDDMLAQLLEDDDTGEYLRLIEKKKARLAKLDLAKAERSNLKKEKLTAKQQRANQELVQLNPSWLEGGQATKAFTDDQALLGQYAKENNFSQDDINAALGSGKLMQAMIDSQKLKSKADKAPEIAKRVRKTPTIIKGKQRQVSSLDKQIQDATTRHKREGSMQSAQALQKLKRQRKAS